MYLAIAVETSGGANEVFVGSKPVTSSDPQVVAEILSLQFAGVPEQILLVDNNTQGHPVVKEHWELGHDYHE